VLIINGDISLDDVKSIVVDKEKIGIDDSICGNIDNCFNFLQSFRKNKIIYGITTGFGRWLSTELMTNIYTSFSTTL
jgi:histidine ammonia-lyase